MKDQSDKLAIVVFCKGVVGYMLVRMIASWSITAHIIPDKLLDLPQHLIPRIFFWPSYWAADHHTAFYSAGIAGLLLLLWLPWNYLGAICFFVFTVNLYRLNFAIANGSDLIVSMLAFYTIGMSMRPKWKNDAGNEIQQTINKLAVIFCQIQVAGIYFVSGWDKLLNEVWRSGEVFVYIKNYDPLFNPIFSSLLESTTVQWIFSWLTILFELAFVVLVWFKKLKHYILLTGVFFHLTIIIMLSLPEFGLLMILSYLIFLKDEDYDRIKSWVKQLRV